MCSTPNTGTVGKNEIKCGNETRHCSKDQECYATGEFAYGQWSDGCRVSCTCSTPNTGTVGQNEIRCGNPDDPEIRHCSEDQECYATGKFTHGEWSDGCRVSCECSTPGQGTVGKNEIKCGNETRHCSSVKECYATEKFAYGEWSDGCRIPGNLIIMSCKYCMNHNKINKKPTYCFLK